MLPIASAALDHCARMLPIVTGLLVGGNKLYSVGKVTFRRPWDCNPNSKHVIWFVNFYYHPIPPSEVVMDGDESF